MKRGRTESVGKLLDQHYIMRFQVKNSWFWMIEWYVQYEIKKTGNTHAIHGLINMKA